MLGATVWLAFAIAGCGGGGSDSSPGAPPAAEASAAAAPAATTATSTQPVAAKSSTTTISFQLAEAATTSAAVYAADGTLVRTLWRGEPRAAGTQAVDWNLRDDANRPVPDGTYEVRVLAHHVRYVWEGVIGNTSAAAPWTGLHKSFGVPTSLAALPGAMVYAVGYNEAQSAIGGFDLDRPQVNRSAIHHTDPFASVAMVAADGSRLYWVNGGGLAKTTFVGVFDLSSGEQADFSEGAPLCLNHYSDSVCYPDQSYRSVIGVRTAEGERPTGIAVQAGGTLLAVAWAVDSRIQLFDKRSGRALGSIAAALQPGATNQLAMTPSGDLWVLGPQIATRYTNLATQPVIAAQVTGLEHPLAVTVDPRDDDAVWIADGGSAQQIKRFDRRGTLQATIAQRGGANGLAAIADDRFCFGSLDGGEAAALAVDSAGSLWATDGCNLRLVRIGADGRVADRISWLPASYVAAVDPGQPSRVFANFLEFEVDGARPIDQPGAWRLVRNWLPALPASLRDSRAVNGQWGGFRLVRTLGNGRTYAVLAKQDDRQQLVELGADGRVRAIGPLPDPQPGATAPYFYENGDLGDSMIQGGLQQVRRWRLTGFDAAGNPQWAAQPQVIASAPAAAGTPYFRVGTFNGIAPPQFPQTASGQVVFFDPSVEGNEGFHLGAVGSGGNRWAWQASPTGPLDGRGSFQTKAVDGSINYGGNAVMALGSSILYGYHGEFYKDLTNGRVGQANQFMHFHENGLFIGQFGVPSTRSTQPVEPGKSGNAFSPTLVRHAGHTYLYHNDESTFGGVHRWRIDGLDTIVELRGAGNAGWPITVR